MEQVTPQYLQHTYEAGQYDDLDAILDPIVQSGPKYDCESFIQDSFRFTAVVLTGMVIGAAIGVNIGAAATVGAVAFLVKEFAQPIINDLADKICAAIPALNNRLFRTHATQLTTLLGGVFLGSLFAQFLGLGAVAIPAGFFIHMLGNALGSETAQMLRDSLCDNEPKAFAQAQLARPQQYTGRDI